tara:strand:+ start:108 stop:509 length:402 start_codon:yes stop_codon:yes gene_type:complete
MGLGKVHPDSVAILFYGMGLARVDYPLGESKGPSRFVVLSQKCSDATPLGMTMSPVGIREDVWAEIKAEAPKRLSLSQPNVMALFDRRDTDSLLHLAHEILYEAFALAAPEYLEEIAKPVGYRIPGWDAKIRG